MYLQEYLRATISVRANFLYILQKKHTFFILHTHFYKTSTSICLFYFLFYLNNHFSHFFLLYFTGPTTLPNSPKYLLHSLSLYFPPSSCFFFFFSFPSPSYSFGIFIFFFSFSFTFFFFFFFFFYLSLIMASDFGFAILVVILGRFFHYMDGDFGALHWLLLLQLLLQHLVLLLFLHFLLLFLQFGFDYLYGCEERAWWIWDLDWFTFEEFDDLLLDLREDKMKKRVEE